MTKTKSAAVDKKKYRATLYMLGVRFVGVGPTVADAIADINPGKARAPRAVLVLENVKAENSKDRIITGPQLSRLFNLSPMMKQIALKQVSALFDL